MRPLKEVIRAVYVPSILLRTPAIWQSTTVLLCTFGLEGFAFNYCSLAMWGNVSCWCFSPGLQQGFLTSRHWHLTDLVILCGGSCPVHCKMCGLLPSLSHCQQHSPSSVFSYRHCQILWGTELLPTEREFWATYILSLCWWVKCQDWEEIPEGLSVA